MGIAVFRPGMGMPGLPDFCGSRGIPMPRLLKNINISQITTIRQFFENLSSHFDLSLNPFW
jgi:hypothetical protein